MGRQPNTRNGASDQAAEDATLVAAARIGDGSALEILLERHQHRIFAVALRMTRNEADAEDVVQQSFHKVFVKLNSFQGRSSFGAWLTRIAMNEALMLLRRRRALREVPLGNSDENEETGYVFEIPDSSPSPEGRYSEREHEQILFLALNELRPGMRAAIQLFELDQRSVKETAQILGISVEAAKSRLFHGRRRLRQAVNGYIASPAHPEVNYPKTAPTEMAICSPFGPVMRAETETARSLVRDG
jgi:RNA polymerase sigma-70 factor (ECF subfamily)